MKLQETLTYINGRGEKLEFSVKSIYHVNMKDVLGLSDIRNEIYSINSMGQDGDTYLGNRIESRDIEISGNIKERDKEQMARYRRLMNHTLNPQHSATLVYQRGRFKRVIDVRINDAPTFPPSSVYQKFVIQLIALNPFWREEFQKRHDVAGWEGLFEFPIRDEDDQPDGIELPIEEEWEIEHRLPSRIVNVYNDGDVRSGMRIEFRALAALDNPVLLNVITGEFIKMNFPMQQGDVLTVSTGYGEKDVTLRRDGVITDAFRYIDVDSHYMQLEVGDNLFRYDADMGDEFLDVTIWHHNNYLGV